MGVEPNPHPCGQLIGPIHPDDNDLEDHTMTKNYRDAGTSKRATAADAAAEG